ncbi:MAG: DUF1552 domain-containing protein [Zavarzinella sp.]
MTSTRRQILQYSLGAGATVLSPMLQRLALHAAGSTAVNQQRVVFVVQSNGMNPDHLRPVGIEKTHRGKYPTNDKTVDISLRDKKLHEALQPLAPFQDRLTLIQHLSGRVGLSDHSANFGALGACSAKKGAISETVDHAVARALPGVIPHVALGLGANPGVTMNYQLSAYGPGKACPIICSPDLAFKSLFGSVADDQSSKSFDQKSNLLDFMTDDIKRAQAGLAGEERHKLDGYLSAFETLHQRQKQIAGMREQLKKHAPNLGKKLEASVSSLILEAQFEIGAAAMIAGLTNVLLLTSGGGGQGFGEFPEMGIAGLHGIGHGQAQNGKPAAQCFIDLRVFHTKLIAGLAKKLAAVPEGNGTMLDNTLIIYLSDSGEQHHPSLYEWPVVLLGNLGGKIAKPGRYLELPGYGQKNHRTLANFYTTLLHSVGKPVDSFGMEDIGLKDIDQKGIVPELLA